MIIQVKGTQQEKAQTDPSQPYALKSMEKKSKTPFALGLMLTGFALYLKSIFLSRAQQEEDEAPAPPDETDGVALPAMMAAEQLPSGSDSEPVATTPPRGEGGSGSGGALISLQPVADFMLLDSPEIGFVIPDPYVGIAELRKPVTSPRAANDNIGGDEIDSPGGWHPGGTDPDGFGPDDGEPSEPDPSETDPNEPDPTDPDPGEDPEPGCQCSEPGDDTDDDDDETINRAPRVSGPVYLMDVTGCAVLAIGLSDLLKNASDPDGDQLSVENLVVSSGTLTQADGGWIFQGGPQLEGVVTITYQVTDGEFEVDQTASFSVVRNTIEGTRQDDLLLGTMCADEINGQQGDDNIDARAGSDIIFGGSGNDHIVAGDGDDVVFAGTGDDIVFGGDGDDHLSGGEGNDRLFGEDGDDVVFGDAGDDHVSGGDGADMLDGGSGDDHLSGGAQDDTLIGGAGDDMLDGGKGDDVLLDGAGEDDVRAGSGSDLVVAAVDAASDRYDGGEGTDKLDYSQTSNGVTVDLTQGTAYGAEIGEDCVTSFEQVAGGSGDDHIRVDDAVAMGLGGGAGDDIFEFSASEDYAAPVTHTILDYEVGDRIRMSKYDLFEKALDEFEDRFEEIYGDDFDDDDVPIRYRHDRTEEMKRTYVEADLNGDDLWETTIMLDGHHILIVVEHA